MPNPFDQFDQAASGPTVVALPQTPQEMEDAARKRRDEGRANASGDREQAGLDLRIKNDRDTDAQRRFGNTRDLKKDYDALPAVKSYEAIVPLVMQGLRANDDATGDQTLLYRYAKVMDPGSVVRESEQGAAANGSNYWDQAVAGIKKQFGVEGGGALPPIVRQRLKRDMLSAAQQMGLAYRQVRDRYARDASDNGIDPRYVIGPDAFEPFVKQFEDYSRKQSSRDDATGASVSSVSPWQFEGPTGSGFSQDGDRAKGIPIPPQMQAEYEGYVKQRVGKLDPQEYARYRNDLAQRYGFGSTPEATRGYEEEAARLNDAARAGGQINLNIPPAEAEKTAQDRINNAIFDNPFGAAAFGAAGGWSDELAGTASSLINGTDRDVEIAKANALRQGMAEKYPGSTLAGGLGVAALGAWAGSAAGLPAFNSTAGAIGTGAALGAFSGAGEDNNNRLRGTLFGGGLGAAGGAAGRALSAPVESLARSDMGQRVGRAVSRLRGQEFTPAPQLSPLESAAYGLRPDVAQASQNLRDAGNLGLPYALADADPKLQMLAGTVTRRSPEAYSLAKGVLNPRDAGQAERAIAGVNDLLAPVTDVSRRRGDLLEAGNIEAAPYYAMAGQRENPIPPGLGIVIGNPSPADREITAMLNTPTGKQALARARKIAADRGISPDSIGLGLDGQGNTVLKQGASFETLDQVKKALDDIIQDHADPITRKIDFTGKPQLQAIDNLRSRFVERMDALNPNYKQARDTYKGYAQRAEALDQGYSATGSKVLPRTLDDITSRWSPEQLAEGQRGYATSMADTIENTRLSANPYNSVYGSMGQREKVGTMFPEGAERFGRQFDLEDQMRGTRQEVLGGSQTAQRLASDQAVGQSALTTALDAGSQLATGGGVSLGSAIQLGKRMFGNRARLGLGRQAEARAAQMAPTLFDTSDPVSAANALDDLARKYGLIDNRRAETARRLGMFGALAAPQAVSGW